MTRLCLAAALLLAAAIPARAQSPQECAPDVETLLLGPAPVPYPEPLLPAAPQARRALAAFRQPDRRGAALGALAPARTARPAAGDCATLIQEQPWTGTAWGADDSRTLAAYDAAGRPLVFTVQRNDGGTLVDAYRSSYVYDTAGTPTEVVVEGTSDPDAGIEPSTRERYATDAAGRILSATVELWDGAAWQQGARIAVTYGDGPHATGFTTEAYMGGAWTPNYRGTFTYTAASARLVSTYEAWTGSAWALDRRETWAYAGPLPASLVTVVGDGTGGLYTQETTFTYAASRLATVLDRVDDGTGALVDLGRTSFSYDASGRLTGELDERSFGGAPLAKNAQTTYTQTPTGLAATVREFWDGTAWVPLQRTQDTRVAGVGLTVRVVQRWDGAAWRNDSRELYRYDGTTAGEPAPDALAARLRAPQPNPTAGRTALAFSLDAAGPARLSVVDVLGREVAVLFDGPAAAGETTVAFDAARLPAGVYAARLAAGGRAQTQRVTVAR